MRSANDDPRRQALVDALIAVEAELRERLDLDGDAGLGPAPSLPVATQPLPNPADLVSMLLRLED